jgi:hypothetical protein
MIVELEEAILAIKVPEALFSWKTNNKSGPHMGNLKVSTEQCSPPYRKTIVPGRSSVPLEVAADKCHQPQCRYTMSADDMLAMFKALHLLQ